MYDVLVVDDSALMRRLICDIISSVQEFSATDSAYSADSTVKRLKEKHYDAVCYNVCMSHDASSSHIFERMKEEDLTVPLIAMCYPTEEATARALKGPAAVVVHPFRMSSNDTDAFAESLAVALRRTLRVSSGSSAAAEPPRVEPSPVVKKVQPSRHVVRSSYPYQLVAIASSTGGPQALHTVIPMLPAKFPVPVVIVQHMPKGFTDSLAKRIQETSPNVVKEAEDGETLKPGHVYIAPGGRHFEVIEDGKGAMKCRVYDAPPVNNLRPCADVMYESLKYLSIPSILCAVLTGMGMDGTVGISHLKKEKNLYCIAQEQSTCVVYGMPKALVNAGLADEVQPLTDIAKSIARKMGV